MDLLTLIDTVQSLTGKLQTVLTVITVAAALLQCYFGYRLLRFWVSFFGGLIGFAIGFCLSRSYLKDSPVWIPVLIGVAAAALLGFLAFRLYLAGVFLFCGLIAAAAVTLIPFPKQSTWQVVETVAIIAAFILCGILAVKFNRQVIILVTAVSGGLRAGSGLAKLVPSIGRMTAGGPLLSAALVLTGIAIQFLTTRKYAKKR
ncbi:MAG: DUF4203 domain-containing protein [Lachnospiraceae bacterium]|jgi:hypothetical protein|nr:DUF4203 domain-containing protein [Lachnospiraceae bacterium]MCI1327569.1 DUF4203 domain-containing protein [Lachnospiraceae bacterium]